MAQQKINNKMNMPRPSWMWIYGVIIIFIVGYWMFGPGNGVPVKSDWNTVAQMIEQGDVEKIQVVNRDLAEIYLKKDAADRYRKDAADPRFRNMPETGAQLTFNIGSVDTFRQDLDKVTAESGNKVVLVYENRENSWTSILLQMLPWSIIIGGWFFLMSRMSRGAGGGAGGIMN
uniref:ATP-dependent metallopeptidase FtsH/Yme1/Tma family protein n=1 Tax=Alistipes putredinis TaxID=28117 RepID=UPI003FD7E760